MKLFELFFSFSFLSFFFLFFLVKGLKISRCPDHTILLKFRQHVVEIQILVLFIVVTPPPVFKGLFETLFDSFLTHGEHPLAYKVLKRTL